MRRRALSTMTTRHELPYTITGCLPKERLPPHHICRHCTTWDAAHACTKSHSRSPLPRQLAPAHRLHERGHRAGEHRERGRPGEGRRAPLQRVRKPEPGRGVQHAFLSQRETPSGSVQAEARIRVKSAARSTAPGASHGLHLCSRWVTPLTLLWTTGEQSSKLTGIHAHVLSGHAGNQKEARTVVQPSLARFIRHCIRLNESSLPAHVGCWPKQPVTHREPQSAVTSIPGRPVCTSFAVVRVDGWS